MDPGEASVIELATELGIGLVLIDERRGRLAARRAGLRVGGSVGVLLRAKTLGLLPLVGPRIEEMRRAGVWISKELQSRVLAQAGEGPQTP
ncbi:MAG: DUF3368 domain-containing protein [Planctomycetes bacterium]|nr:DUF3368 domain-containing protein [Planctomycetota bacterium]